MTTSPPAPASVTLARLGQLEPCVPGLPVYADPAQAWADGVELLLLRDKAALALVAPGSAEKPLAIYFDEGQLGFRLTTERVRHERLIRAVGGMPDKPVTVVDATAGLGRDSALLACAGFQVVMLERCAVLAALLADAITRAPVNLQSRMQLTHADAAAWLQEHPRVAEVVYLDPMFPARSKSAAVKKGMSMLQKLLMYPTAGEEKYLLEAALHGASKKVVVKRPNGAPPLGEAEGARVPASSLKGKTVRFDIYPV